MKYDPERHHRRTVRLRNHNYDLSGPYFVTICTKQRALILDDPQIRSICTTAWRFFLKLSADPEPWDFVVMPNHVHGVAWLPGRGDGAQHVPSAPCDLVMRDWEERGYRGFVSKAAPLQRIGPRRGALADFVASFKSLTARRVNLCRRTPGAEVWQSNYYEHIIRGSRDLNAIRAYILNNPRRWADDPENSARTISHR